jgi:hypothetical protein
MKLGTAGSDGRSSRFDDLIWHIIKGVALIVVVGLLGKLGLSMFQQRSGIPLVNTTVAPYRPSLTCTYVYQADVRQWRDHILQPVDKYAGSLVELNLHNDGKVPAVNLEVELSVTPGCWIQSVSSDPEMMLHNENATQNQVGTQWKDVRDRRQRIELHKDRMIPGRPLLISVIIHRTTEDTPGPTDLFLNVYDDTGMLGRFRVTPQTPVNDKRS